MTIQLGSKVQDTVTGLTGIATARVEYLHGEPRIEVSVAPSADGKPIEPVWFDEGRIREARS